MVPISAINTAWIYVQSQIATAVLVTHDNEINLFPHNKIIRSGIRQ